MVVISLTLAALPNGCATPPPQDDPEAVAAYKETNDPLEPMNRAIFDFNITLDEYVLRPIAWGYREVLPLTIRNMVRNFLNNLQTPVILANDIFQAEWDRAGNTAIRGAMNTTLGFGGVADIASEMGFPRHSEDFGQTLAVYGADSGPYLMLPFLGPSNPRDAAGFVVDIFLDPLTYFDIPFEYRAGEPGTDAVSLRARNFEAIDELQRTSLDYYAAVRSLFWQRRKDQIHNGRPPTENKSSMNTHDHAGTELGRTPMPTPMNDGRS